MVENIVAIGQQKINVGTFKKSLLNSQIIINRDSIIKIKKFFNNKNINIIINNGFCNVTEISLPGNIKIKDAKNKITPNLLHRIKISKTYVATTSNVVASKCKDFYSKIKEIKLIPSRIVKIDKETNLLKVLNENSVSKKGIQLFMRKLNFRNDYCQKIDENISEVMYMPKEATERLKPIFLSLSTRLNNDGTTYDKLHNELIYMQKKILRKKKTGYVNIVIVTLLSLLFVGLISFYITFKILQ